jgi:hypothetical protein
MTQDWTANPPHQQQLPACFLSQDRRLPNTAVRKATMSSPDPSDNPFDSYDQWDPYDDCSQQQTQATRANKLGLCQLLGWDSERIYDEDPPIYIHYSIERKVTVNNRAIMPKDTEQDIVLALAAYWQHSLGPKLKNLLRKMNRPCCTN